jgi:hypothetical protein
VDSEKSTLNFADKYSFRGFILRGLAAKNIRVEAIEISNINKSDINSLIMIDSILLNIF